MSRILDERDKKSIENKIIATADTINNNIDDLDEYVKEQDADIRDIISEHKDNTDNPHKIIYTDASVLASLSSGEKLSVAFGKIAKAITDLISHIANKENPHSVTTYQIGALAKDNEFTSDADIQLKLGEKKTLINSYNSSTVHTPYKPGKDEDTGEEKPSLIEYSSGIIITSAHSNTYATQLALPNGGRHMYVRGMSKGVVYDWVEFYSTNKKPTASDVGAYTQKETDEKIANLVDSAPETLNTLNELATALGDDPNFATTMATELGKKTNNVDFEVHTSNVSNPHSVSKSQVGLGNVPNVATNDQTPTYTEATTLATIVSGEKLSVSFGKIMKAITDLISHIGNKSNPHAVTKDQVGLGNVDNTSDANKPVSAAQNIAISHAKLELQEKINIHLSDLDNPHEVNAYQVGLGNVDNTSDVNKPVSTAQATAIADAKKAGTDAQNVINSHIESENPHNITVDLIGADVAGSAAQALIDAKNYTNSKISTLESNVDLELETNRTLFDDRISMLETRVELLPPIKDEDEGKVLCVVNGAFTLVSISDLLSDDNVTPEEPVVPDDPENTEEPNEPEV